MKESIGVVGKEMFSRAILSSREIFTKKKVTKLSRENVLTYSGKSHNIPVSGGLCGMV